MATALQLLIIACALESLAAIGITAIVAVLRFLYNIPPLTPARVKELSFSEVPERLKVFMVRPEKSPEPPAKGEKKT